MNARWGALCVLAACLQVSETFAPGAVLVHSCSSSMRSASSRLGVSGPIMLSAPASNKPLANPVLAKPVGRPQTTSEDAAAPQLQSDLALTMFQMADQDASESLCSVEFEDLVRSVDPDMDSDHIMSTFQSIVCDEDQCNESISFLGFYRWLKQGLHDAETGATTKSLQQKLVRQNYVNQAELLFKEADQDGSGTIDAAELKVLGDAMGLKWTRNEAKEVLADLDTDESGAIDFEEFFDWFCNQKSAARDRTGAFASQLRLMLRAHGIEQKQVLITGFPFKAGEAAAKRFFSRCGTIANVKVLPWAKTGRPSGRFVIEFQDLEGAQAALAMHKKKMGPRDLGVFRINVGDSEETMPMAKDLHAAVLGPQGSFLQSQEAESGARIFLRRNETHGWVTLKGTPRERETAKKLIFEATQGGVASESVSVKVEFKDLLLARKGRALHKIESRSGARVYVTQVGGEREKKDAQSNFGVKKSDIKTASNAMVQVTGVREQRMQAKAALEDFMSNHVDEMHSMPAKFHGTLKGKNAIVVQRVEAETDTMVSFRPDGGGTISISGNNEGAAKAWAMMQHFKKTLPALLTKLRDSELKVGELASVPMYTGKVDAELVWPLALEEALVAYKKAARVF